MERHVSIEPAAPRRLDALPAPDSFEVAVRAHGMRVLQGAIARCPRCVLAGHLPVARPVTRGKGAVDAPLMIVGQAPGATGSDHDRPFSGAAGRTLDAWLVTAGFPPGSHHDPDLCFLTSVTRCFPGKSAGGSGSGGKGDRMPGGREVALCRPYLDREFALVRPTVVVALGRLAATEIIGPAPLSELIDRVIEVERAGVRFPVVTLPHPSGVSRWLNAPDNRVRHVAALERLGDMVREAIEERRQLTVDRPQTVADGRQAIDDTLALAPGG